MSLVDYITPTPFRLMLWIALLVIANLPYVGTVVSGQSQCLKADCISLEACSDVQKCVNGYQARPSEVFWWPYPSLSLSYTDVAFSEQAIPLSVIFANASLLFPQALALTFLYWYALAVIITIPGSERRKKEDNYEV